MASPNLRKYNSLLSTIRNTENSFGKREAALKELENLVNDEATKEDARFHATLANFDKQWATFENTLGAMDNAFSSLLGDDENDPEVNELMELIKDETLFDKKFSSQSNTLSKPTKKFNPNAPSPITEEFINDLKKLATEAENKELSLDEEFQLALDSLTQKNVYPKTTTPLSPPKSSYKSSFNPIQETKPSNYQPDLSRQSMPSSTYSSKKSNLFESFIKHVVEFVKGVGEFFQKNNTTSSIEKMSAQLKNATEELKSTKKQLDKTESKLLKNIQTHQKRKNELETKNTRFNEVYSQLNNLNHQKITSPDNQLEQQIKDTEKVCKDVSREIKQLSNWLERSTNQITQTQAQLEKADKAYLIADKTLSKVMAKVENILKSRHDNPNQSNQSRIKELLQEGKSHYQQSHEKTSSEINSSNELNTPKYR